MKDNPSLYSGIDRKHQANKSRIHSKTPNSSKNSVENDEGVSLPLKGEDWMTAEQARIKKSSTKVQSEIEKIDEKARDDKNKGRQKFRNDSGIVETPSGNISSKKSLFGKANKLVTEDPDIVAEEIKEIGNSGMKKLKEFFNKR